MWHGGLPPPVSKSLTGARPQATALCPSFATSPWSTDEPCSRCYVLLTPARNLHSTDFPVRVRPGHKASTAGSCRTASGERKDCTVQCNGGWDKCER